MILPRQNLVVPDNLNGGVLHVHAVSLEWPCGTDVVVPFALVHQDGSVYDISGAIALTLSFKTHSSDATPVLSRPAIITGGGTGGLFEFHVATGDRGLLQIGRYALGISFKDNATMRTDAIAAEGSRLEITDPIANITDPITTLPTDTPLALGPTAIVQSPLGTDLPSERRLGVDGTLLSAADDPSHGRTVLSAPGLVSKAGADTISGLKSFTTSPTAPDPTTAQQVATKNYVDIAVVSIVRDYIFYLAQTSGNDANDGLTTSTPKKTLAAVMALFPPIYYRKARVYLQENYVLSPSEPQSYSLPLAVGNMAQTFVILGNIGGSPWADAHAELTVTGSNADGTDITASAYHPTLDQYRRARLIMTSGAAIGQIVSVRRNSTLGQYFLHRPIGPISNGDKFKLQRPSTTLDISAGGLAFFSAQAGAGRLQIIATVATGDAGFLVYENLIFYLGSCEIIGSGISASALIGSQSSGLIGNMAPDIPDLSDVVKDNAATYCANINLSMSLLAQAVESFILDGAEVSVTGFDRGSWAAWCDSDGSAFQFLSNAFCSFGPNTSSFGSGSVISRIKNSSADGIYLDQFSTLTSMHGIDISNSAGSAFNCLGISKAAIGNKQLGSFSLPITGTGNARYGLEIAQGSKALVLADSMPTVTGTLGDILLDGALETWADVLAESPKSVKGDDLSSVGAI